MYKVVVVEDEKLVREGIVHGTEWSRIDCMVAGAAGDGEEGIEAVHKYHPDVIVTDICMPKKIMVLKDFAGFQVVRETSTTMLKL